MQYRNAAALIYRRSDAGGDLWRALDQITADGRYATIMAETGQYEPFPPVVLFRNGETLWLSAGFHRVAAVMLADEQLITEGEEPMGVSTTQSAWF